MGGLLDKANAEKEPETKRPRNRGLKALRRPATSGLLKKGGRRGFSDLAPKSPAGLGDSPRGGFSSQRGSWGLAVVALVLVVVLEPS
ncbi:MAG: hypothetical protein CM15mP78_03990 [Candidatus Poseidoniales archaeon]|nr:MAG: hypothetical protein CM15mP78_03990 [Candidatus Poseidoniales archaeon]